MRLFIYICLVLGFAQAACAQSAEAVPELIPLEGGYFLEISPAQYEIRQAELPDHLKNRPKEWITIPAVFETITETIIVQDAYTDLKVVPAVRSDDGAVLKAAELSLEPVPAVTRKVTRRVVKTPARQVFMRVPQMISFRAERVRVSEKAYILLDAEQVEIGRFETPEALLAAIER